MSSGGVKHVLAKREAGQIVSRIADRHPDRYWRGPDYAWVSPAQNRLRMTVVLKKTFDNAGPLAIPTCG
jgi:hypothetical protein